METRIFEDRIDYQDDLIMQNLNSEFSDKSQLSKLLYNEDSPYDLKSVLAVKKLDNSIYQFKELAVKGKEIIREKSKIYQQ